MLKASLKIALMLAGIGALLFALLDPSSQLPEIRPPWDKACHFAAFYGLTLLANVLFSPKRPYALIALVILAGLSEYLQGLPMIHRDAEVSDSVADLIGMLAACLPLWVERLRARVD